MEICSHETGHFAIFCSPQVALRHTRVAESMLDVTSETHVVGLDTKLLIDLCTYDVHSIMTKNSLLDDFRIFVWSF